MRVEQRVRPEVERALRQNPTLEVHAEDLDHAVEIQTGPGLRVRQLVQRVHRAVAAEDDPLITCPRVVVEDLVDGVREGRLGRGRRELRDHARRILRQEPEQTAGIAERLAIRASRLVTLAEQEGQLHRDRMVEHLALLVVLDRIAGAGLEPRRRIGQLVGRLEDLRKVVQLRWVPGGGRRGRRTFREGVTNAGQGRVGRDRCSRRTLRSTSDGDRATCTGRRGGDDFVRVRAGDAVAGRLVHEEGIASHDVGRVRDVRSDDQGRVGRRVAGRVVDGQAESVQLFLVPGEFRVIGRLGPDTTEQGGEWRLTSRIAEEDHFPKVLRALVSGEVTGATQSCNCHFETP